MKLANYLLDTNAISEAVKSRQNVGYMNWLNSTEDSRMYLSCLSVGEIQKGVSLTSSLKLHDHLDKYLANLYEAFGDRILSLTPDDCTLWGELTAKAQRAGKTPPVIDALIAAQCIQHQLTLVTRNTKDFKQFTDLKVFCPWTDTAR